MAFKGLGWDCPQQNAPTFRGVRRDNNRGRDNRRVDGGDFCKLFVRNIKHINSNNLRHMLSTFGDIVHFFRQDDTSGYCIVTYAEKNEAAAALIGINEIDPQIVVEYSKPKTPHSSSTTESNAQSNGFNHPNNHNNTNMKHHDQNDQCKKQSNYNNTNNNTDHGKTKYVVDDDDMWNNPASSNQSNVTSQNQEKNNKNENFPSITSNISNDIVKNAETVTENGSSSTDAVEMGPCNYCETVTFKMCGRCNDFYCSINCQKRDWRKHKLVCFPIPDLLFNNCDTVNDLQKLKIQKSNNQDANSVEEPISGRSSSTVPDKMNVKSNEVIVEQQQKHDFKNETAQQSGNDDKQRFPSSECVDHKKNQQQQHQQLQKHQQQQQLFNDQIPKKNNLPQKQSSVSHQQKQTFSPPQKPFNKSSMDNLKQQPKQQQQQPNEQQQQPKQQLQSQQNAKQETIVKSNNLMENSLNMKDNNNKKNMNINSITKTLQKDVPEADQKKMEYFPANKSKVIMTGYADAKTVFLRSADTEASFEYLKVIKIVDTYAQTAESLTKTPVHGEHVLAPFCGAYYRGLVLDVKNKNSVKILFIDFGNEDIVDVSELKEISVELSALKRYPHKCILRLPIDGNTDLLMNTEVFAFMDELTDGLVEMEVTYDEARFNQTLVDLNVLETNLSINDKIMSFLKDKQTLEKSGKTEIFYKDDIKYKTVNGENVSLMILEPYSENNLFRCILSADYDMFKHNHYVMQGICELNKSTYAPSFNEICFARWNGEWFRGVCYDDNLTDEPDCRMIAFIDFGNHGKVHVNHIRQMERKFTFDCITYSSKVKGLPKHLSKRAILRVKELLGDVGKTIYVKKVSTSEQTDGEILLLDIPHILEVLKLEKLL